MNNILEFNESDDRKVTKIYWSRFGCSIISGITLLFLILLFIITILKNKCKKRKNVPALSPIIREDTTEEIKTSHWIIFLIAISELIGCLGIIINIPKNDSDTSCKIQGALLTFCEVTTISFTSVLSFWIYQLSKGTKSIDEIQGINIISIIYGYLPGIIFLIAPLLLDTEKTGGIYGLSGHWCWIRYQLDKKFTEMLEQNIYSIIFYTFSWGNLLYSIFAMISSLSNFSEFAKRIEEQNEEGFLRIKFFCDFIFYFPLIRVLGWLIPTANRLYGIITRKENTLLYLAHGISMSSIGFFNSIVFFIYQFKPFVQIERAPKEHPSTDNESIDLYPDDD